MAAGPESFDCSGLTMAAWRTAGVSLPHSTTGQLRAVRKINRSELRPGDLVFYYAGLSHVAIYLGNNMIIDAPRSGKRIAVRGIDIMPAVAYGSPAGN
jgi:cell wall-associated NlpC family hydrolase